jgi:uncharacterized membrane protein
MEADTVNWTHAGPAILAAFLASFVEFVEALTIVLAAGLARGWRSALLGAFTGAAILSALVALLGSNLRLVPLKWLQVSIGILLVLFGTRWLRKAVLRAAGVLDMHDEEQIFTRQTHVLSGRPAPAVSVIDPLGFVTSLKGVFVEGLEVVFVVIAIGATGGLLVPAAAGALLAGFLVLFLGFAVHRPLARVPENSLKFAVGVMLSAFGAFWTGEGLGFEWPGGDWAIPFLIGAFVLASLVAVRVSRVRSHVEVFARQ